MIIDELDLMRRGGERRAAEAQFRGLRLLYVPEVYWDLLSQERDGDGARARRAHQRHP